MTKHPTKAEKAADRDAERKAEMDAAFEDEHAKSNPVDPDPIPEAKSLMDPPPESAPKSVTTGEPMDVAHLPGQIQRRMTALRAAAGDFHVPDEVLLAMAQTLESKE